MGAKIRFLEAGNSDKVAPVRPRSTSVIKGLGQAEEEEHMLITEDGQMLPRDVDDRDRETEMFEAGEGAEAEVVDSPVVEEVMVKARRPPQEPSEAERLRHEATRIPYRSWCQECVRGRGRCKPHYRRIESDPANAVPKISMDYFFLGDESAEASENPMIVLVDEEKGQRCPARGTKRFRR